MTLHLPRLPFGLDPLVAEAKRRARRRRVLLVVLLAGLAIAAVAVTLALRPTGGPRSPVLSPRRAGIARVSGMTELASDRSTKICDGAGLQPSYCEARATQGLDQTWLLTPAVKRYGRPLRAAVKASGFLGVSPSLIPLAVVRRHPGPAEVEVSVRTFQGWAGRGVATMLLHDSGYVGSDNMYYTSLPGLAINGGLAGLIGRRSGGFADSQTEFSFAWTAGRSVVQVIVAGADLSASQAQHIARLAGPA